MLQSKQKGQAIFYVPYHMVPEGRGNGAGIYCRLRYQKESSRKIA